MKPAEISKFCGGERVDGFEAFLESGQARQVHRLTKTAMELYDESAAAKGASRDPSLKDVPLRALAGNSGSQIYAMKYLKETKKMFNPSTADTPQKKEAYAIVSNCVDLIKRINAAEVANGKGNGDTEKALKAETKKMRAVTKPAANRSADGGILLIRRGNQR